MKLIKSEIVTPDIFSLKGTKPYVEETWEMTMEETLDKVFGPLAKYLIFSHEIQQDWVFSFDLEKMNRARNCYGHRDLQSWSGAKKFKFLPKNCRFIKIKKEV